MLTDHESQTRPANVTFGALPSPTDVRTYRLKEREEVAGVAGASLEEKEFHDGGLAQTVCAPELGFLFPAFDNRATNIYNALFYTRSPKKIYENVVDALFRVEPPKPAAEQKKSFEALLSTALDEECDLDVVQTVHEQLCQRIELHKESRVPEPLMVSTPLPLVGIMVLTLCRFALCIAKMFSTSERQPG